MNENNTKPHNTGIRINSFVVSYNGTLMTNETFARTVNINPHKTLRLLKEGKTAEAIAKNRDPIHDKYICYGHSKNSIFLTKETEPNQPGSLSRVEYEINGVKGNLTELCKILGNGITRKEAQRRISRGWSVEKAVLTPVVRRKNETEDDNCIVEEKQK